MKDFANYTIMISTQFTINTFWNKKQHHIKTLLSKIKYPEATILITKYHLALVIRITA